VGRRCASLLHGVGGEPWFDHVAGRRRLPNSCTAIRHREAALPTSRPRCSRSPRRLSLSEQSEDPTFWYTTATSSTGWTRGQVMRAIPLAQDVSERNGMHYVMTINTDGLDKATAFATTSEK
jgi:hypothetical protein